LRLLSRHNNCLKSRLWSRREGQKHRRKQMTGLRLRAMQKTRKKLRRRETLTTMTMIHLALEVL
jgi:hypothetical protein